MIVTKVLPAIITDFALVSIRSYNTLCLEKGVKIVANGERIVPGCGNCDSFTGVCRVVFKKTETSIPSLAKETLIDPPGALEGPSSPGVPGLVCTVSQKPDLQKDCSYFMARTTADDLRDENI